MCLPFSLFLVASASHTVTVCVCVIVTPALLRAAIGGAAALASAPRPHPPAHRQPVSVEPSQAKPDPESLASAPGRHAIYAHHTS